MVGGRLSWWSGRGRMWVWWVRQLKIGGWVSGRGGGLKRLTKGSVATAWLKMAEPAEPSHLEPS